MRLVLILALLSSSCASATRSDGLKFSYSALIVAHQLDVITTSNFLAKGQEEGNNLFRNCVKNITCMVGFKTAAALGTIALIDGIIRPKSEEAAKATIWINVGITAAAALTNALNTR